MQYNAFTYGPNFNSHDGCGCGGWDCSCDCDCIIIDFDLGPAQVSPARRDVYYTRECIKRPPAIPSLCGGGCTRFTARGYVCAGGNTGCGFGCGGCGGCGGWHGGCGCGRR